MQLSVLVVVVSGSEDQVGAFKVEWRSHSARSCDRGSCYDGGKCEATPGLPPLFPHWHCVFLPSRISASRSGFAYFPLMLDNVDGEVDIQFTDTS